MFSICFDCNEKDYLRITKVLKQTNSVDLILTIISVQNKLLGFEINQMIVTEITVTLLREVVL